MNKFTQDAVCFKRLIQQAKEPIVKEETRNRLLLLKQTNQLKSEQDPAIVFTSLLHKTVSMRGKDQRGFEDTFYLLF